VDGQLSCVPGVSADPQSQIRALRQQINTDLQQESAVQQQIDGLQQLVLQGEAVQGAVLQATAVADVLAALPASAFHWYRRSPGANQWLLIEGAAGPSYVLQLQDVSAQVMVVVAVPAQGGGSSRQASPAIGQGGFPPKAFALGGKHALLLLNQLEEFSLEAWIYAEIAPHHRIDHAGLGLLHPTPLHAVVLGFNQNR
jgi:hypothetical protein